MPEQGVKIIIEVVTSEAEAAVGRMRNALDSLGSSVSRVGQQSASAFDRMRSEAAATGTALSAPARRAAELEAAIAENQRQLQLFERELRAVREEIRGVEARVSEARQEFGRKSSVVSNLQQRLTELRQIERGLVQDSRMIKGETRALSQQLSQLSSEGAKGEGIFRSLSQRLLEGGGSVRDLLGGLGLLRGGLLAIGSAAILAFSRLEELGRQFLDQVDAASDMARALGLSAGQLQLLQHAATLSGVSVERLLPVVARLAEILESTDESAIVLKQRLLEIGVSSGDVGEALDQLAAAISQAADKQRLLGTLAELFGARQARVLIAALDELGQSGSRVRAEIEALGISFDEFVQRAQALELLAHEMKLFEEAVAARFSGISLAIRFARTELMKFVLSGDIASLINPLRGAARAIEDFSKLLARVEKAAERARETEKLRLEDQVRTFERLAALADRETALLFKRQSLERQALSLQQAAREALARGDEERARALLRELSLVQQRRRELDELQRARERDSEQTRQQVEEMERLRREIAALQSGRLTPVLRVEIERAELEQARRLLVEIAALSRRLGVDIPIRTDTEDLERTLKLLHSFREASSLARRLGEALDWSSFIKLTEAEQSRLLARMKELAEMTEGQRQHAVRLARLQIELAELQSRNVEGEKERLVILLKTQTLQEVLLRQRLLSTAVTEEERRALEALADAALSSDRVRLAHLLETSRLTREQIDLVVELTRTHVQGAREIEEALRRQAEAQKRVRDEIEESRLQARIALLEAMDEAAKAAQEAGVHVRVSEAALERIRLLGEQEIARIRRQLEERVEAARRAGLSEIEIAEMVAAAEEQIAAVRLRTARQMAEEQVRQAQIVYEKTRLLFGLTRGELRQMFEEAVVRARSFGDFLRTLWASLADEFKRRLASALADLLFGPRPQAGQPVGLGVIGVLLGGTVPPTTPPFVPPALGRSFVPGERPDLPISGSAKQILNVETQSLGALRELESLTERILATLREIHEAVQNLQRILSNSLDRIVSALEFIAARIERLSAPAPPRLLPGGVVLGGFPGIPPIPSGPLGGMQIPGLDVLSRILFPGGFNIGGVIGGGLGSMLGGGSTLGRLLAGLGGGILGSLIFAGAAGAAGGVGIFSGIATALLSNPFAAIVGAALLPLGILFGRIARRGREKRIASASVEELFQKLRELIAEVQTDQTDGHVALQQAEQLWNQWVQFLHQQLKDRTVIRRSIESQRPFFEAHLAWLRAEAERQLQRRRIREFLIPEFHRGGRISFALLEPGEIYVPPRIVDAVGASALDLLNSSDTLRPSLLPALLSGGMVVPGRSRGRDEVLAVVEEGGFVINRRTAEKLTGGMRLLSTDTSDPARIVAARGMLQSLQGGGLIRGGLSPELILFLLYALQLGQAGLTAEELALLLRIFQGIQQGGTIPPELRAFILSALDPFLSRIPEPTRSQIRSALSSAQTFADLLRIVQNVLSTPALLQGVLQPVLSFLPPPLRGAVAGGLAAALPDLLAGRNLGELLGDRDFLIRVLLGVIGGLPLPPAQKALLQVIVPALIERKSLTELLKDPRFVQPILQPLLPPLLGLLPAFRQLPEAQQQTLVQAIAPLATQIVTGIAGRQLEPATIQQLALLVTPLLPRALQPFGILAGFFAPELAARASGQRLQNPPGVIERLLPLLPILVGFFAGPGVAGETAGLIALAQILSASSATVSSQGQIVESGGGVEISPLLPDFPAEMGVVTSVTPAIPVGAPALTAPASPPPSLLTGGGGGTRREVNNFFLIIGPEALEEIAAKLNIPLRTVRAVRAITVRGF